MKKNKKRKERMAAVNAITNPSISMNEKYESPKSLKRQREEEDFVNGKKDKVKQVDSPQKKRKEKHQAKGKETPKSPSQKSPSKPQKSPGKVNDSKTSKTTPSLNGDSNPDLSDLFSEPDRLLPGPKRKEMTKSYASSKPYYPSILHRLTD
jgi:hypothetical protein